MPGMAAQTSWVQLVRGGGCPPAKQRLLRNQQVMPVLAQASAALHIDPDFLTALCAFETGWLSAYSQQLMNLFGISRNEVPEKFVSYSACAQAWLGYFGGYVDHAGSAKDFVDGLRKAHYNTVNAGYYAYLTKLILAMPQARKDCGLGP
jgi:hypothetical protein